ncbi:hypothetical protein GCM10020254_30760 [Streptomyces goshikiensis]
MIAEAVDSEIVATDDDGEDSGTEGSVRGGKQFDPIADVIARFFREADYPDICIHTASQLELPGFYRPQKKWDLVVNWGRLSLRRSSSRRWAAPRTGTTSTIASRKP